MAEKKELDELMELCNKEGVELPDELLEGVAGGVLSPEQKERLREELHNMGFSDEIISHVISIYDLR